MSDRPMRMRYGVHRPLEDAADALIFAAVGKIKKHSENDILTPWKEKDRRKHEIYVPSGVPDAANRQGIYHRSTNSDRPDLNSREGVARGLHSRVTKNPERINTIYPNTTHSTMNWAAQPGSHYRSHLDSLYGFVNGGEDHDGD